jgi:dihydrofolate reductase
MRRVIACEWMSLDGVVQAPAYSDEDPSGGFKHGGWHLPYFDDTSMKWVVETVSGAGGYLFGRRTYDVFAAYWPNAPDDQQMLAVPLNTLPKYVASRSLRQPPGWRNSRLLEGDIVGAVGALKRERGKDLLAIGSTELVQALVVGGLVDELRLMIDPVTLGGGKRFLPNDGVLRGWRLASSQVTSTGAMLVSYARATPLRHTATPLPQARSPSATSLASWTTRG